MIDPLDKEKFMRQMEKAQLTGDYSERAVERFHEWMYGRSDGMVQVCAFPVPTENQDVSEMGDGKYIHARSYAEFEDFCNTHSGLWRYHVYAGVNPLHEEPKYGRGRVDHVNRVQHLSFDIELERESYGGAENYEVWWAYRYALAQVKFMAVNYDVWPLVVMSENGIHLHYKVDFDNREELLDGRQHVYTKYLTHEAMNSPHAQAVRDKTPDGITIDQDDVSDVPRVMKVPGTRGIKSDMGRLCGIIHEPPVTDAGVITEDQIDVTISDVEDLKDSISVDKSDVESVDTTPGTLDDLTARKVKREIMTDPVFTKMWQGHTDSYEDIRDTEDGKDPNYESRSEAEFGFVIKLISSGFTPDQIVDVMWASGMSKWDEEGDNYRERTVRRAIEFYDGPISKGPEDGSLNFERK